MRKSEYKPTFENIFFMCYLVEKISRDTRNNKPYVVSKMDRDYVLHMCEYEDIYHSQNLDKVVFEECEQLGIKMGRNTRLTTAKYRIPTINAMAELYRRLIYKLEGEDIIDSFFKVMSSPMTDFIDDYNSSFYYENPDYIKDCILEGRLIILGKE